MALNIVIIPKKKEKRRLTWLLQAQYRSQINLQLLLIIQSRTLRWAIITEETWAAQTPAPQLCVPYPAVPSGTLLAPSLLLLHPGEASARSRERSISRRVRPRAHLQAQQVPCQLWPSPETRLMNNMLMIQAAQKLGGLSLHLKERKKREE